MKLNNQEIQSKMKEIGTNWVLKEPFIQRDFLFENFIEAFAFMTSVALIAEKLNHHPYWENTYNKVSISLSTHEAAGLTDLDFKFAKEVDKIINK
jgi:4a-hydroxytetrahydrobiopterin dehydratase